MKKNAKGLIFSWLIIALAFFCGCSEPNSVEEIEALMASDAAFQEAIAYQKAGDYDAARELFKKIVVAQPTNALARLHYGIILQDVSPTDPYAALSNFEAYIVLAPDSDKRELVEERIQKARRQISSRFDETLIEDRERKINLYITQIRELNNKISELEQELELSEQVIANVEEDRDNEIVINKRLRAVIETLSSGNSIASVEQPKNANRTYKVRRGDTLWSIARDIYGDPNRSSDIRAANGLKEDEPLVEGREIIIP